MIVGTCRLELFLPDSGSLKSKRGVLKGLKERIRNRFNVSVAEVDHHDLWQRSTLAVAVVSTGKRHADSVLTSVVRFVEKEGRAELIGCETELY